MKRSIYNYVVENEGKYIVFNTLNTSLIVLDDKSYNEFINDDYSSLDISILKENGFVVEDDSDEKSLVDYSRAATIFSKGYRYFRILTTTACNARCDYCYEAGATNMTMDEETAKAVIKYIEDICIKDDVERLSIAWFGGEPLVNHEIISFISKELRNFTFMNGIGYEVSMTSNASLFTDELIKKAKFEWKLNRIQITLDGTRENYNRIKAYVNDKYNFDVVFSNIKKLIDEGIYVNIRMNYNMANYDNILELIDYIYDNLKDRKHWDMYVFPIFDCKNSSYKKEDMEKFCSINEKIRVLREHPVMKLPHFREGGCIFTTHAGEGIMPNGDLIKCCRLMNTDTPFANVRDDLSEYNAHYTKWVNPVLPEKCNNCVKLPICQGGCRAEQMLGFDGCSPWIQTLDQRLIDYVNAVK